MLHLKFKNLLTDKITYLKYLFSYLVIVTVLIISFFFIIKNRLEKRFFEQYLRQSDIKVELISKYIGDELRGISLVTDSVKANPSFNYKTYHTKGGCSLQIYNEMMKYTAAMRMVQTMVYYSEGLDEVISTKQKITYNDGIFYIMNGAESFSFDPSPYYNKIYGQLIFAYNENSEYLIYFPSISAGSGDVFFYILKTNEILELMKNVISEELVSIALLNHEGKVVVGENLSQLLPELKYLLSYENTENEQVILKNGIYEVNNSNSINVHSNIDDEFTLVALVSGDYLESQIGSVFAESYPALVLMGIIGLLLIQLVMRITYVPLHRLTHKIVSGSKTSKDYLKLLDENFDRTMKQNEDLKSKVKGYRLFIQKSMLETILSTRQGLEGEGEICDINIDRFFTEGFNEKIYVIKMASPGKSFACEEMQNYMREMLPGDEPCTLMERQQEGAVYLINYSGMEMDKDNVVENMLMQICEDYGVLAAVSGSSESPLDIPMLYNNAMSASSYWSKLNFVDYRTLPNADLGINYPQDRLNHFSELLTKNQFSDAEKELNELLEMMNDDFEPESELTDFYMRSVLIDVLFAIADCLKQYNAELPDEYHEALYYCRSFLYKEKRDGIISNIYKILATLKNSIIGFHAEMLKEAIDESYSDPNFSITVMADSFRVSIAYMSYLVKKNLGQNFSDYLWSLRVNKAKELLLTTDIPIDQISIEVGYVNPDSFRRKFKTETGVTPVQFRREGRSES